MSVIQLTPSAVREVLRLKATRKGDNSLFRLWVRSGGCLGMSYGMTFDTAAQAGEQVYQCNGVEVVIDAESVIHLHGLVIDYSEDLMGGGFRFQNPKVAQSCGCGNSFRIAE